MDPCRQQDLEDNVTLLRGRQYGPYPICLGANCFKEDAVLRKKEVNFDYFVEPFCVAFPRVRGVGAFENVHAPCMLR